MIITGIGSRHTPPDVCELFTELASEARERDWWVRSGHAHGADYAFEKGARERCIAYLPWNGFNADLETLGATKVEPLREDVLKIVYKHEPYAKDLSDGVKRIKSRNVYQVLGVNLKAPSDVVVCWTIDGDVVGGTALAIKIANTHGIPVVNVGDPETARNLFHTIREIAQCVS